MKIFNAQQIYDADKFTIEKQNIESEMLMERAAVQIFNWMHLRMQGAPVKVHLFCGIGNNGGDGIALARHLQEHGYNIAVHVVNYSEKRSKDFLINLNRLQDRKVWPNFLNHVSEFPAIDKNDVIVDAIFGIGLNRAPDQWVVNLIEYLNASSAFILSIDLPSGLFMETGVDNTAGIIKANHVLSFQAPKLVFFLPETGVNIGQWEILDIGLDMEFLSGLPTQYELMGKSEVVPMYLPRNKFSHKGTYGHSLIIGGSYGKIGAVILSAKACLKAGSGLVTSYVPSCGYIPMQTSLAEAMVVVDQGEKELIDITFDIVPSVIGIGIGLGVSETTTKAFTAFLKHNKSPLVVDADALNILSKNKSLLKLLPADSVLTPHPKELERLIGPWKDDFEKLKKAKMFSNKYNIVLVIKGAHSMVIYKGIGYINSTGNPGMATAGSGDVLTGVITGLIAQGYASSLAAVFGVYLHGKAGDIAVEDCGYEALTASGIIECIGKAYLDLFYVPQPKQEKEQEEVEEAKS